MALPVVVGGASKTTTTRPSSSSSSSSRSRSSTSSTTSTRTMRIGLVVVFMVGSTLLKYPSILKSFLVVVGPSSSASSSTTTTSTTEISSTALSSSSSSSSSSSHRSSWRDLPDGCVTRPYKSGPMTTMSSSSTSTSSTSFSIPQVLEDAFQLLDAHLDEHAPLSSSSSSGGGGGGDDNTGTGSSTTRRRYWKDVRPMSVAATALQGYKVNFLWNVIQRWKDGDGDGDGGGDNKKVECRTVCEVGLNAGHSSVLWLEACPEANAVLFDLPKNRYSQAAYDFLKLHYASRITAITLGNSLETIPQYIIQQQQNQEQQQQHSNGSSSRPLRCDLIAIDGSKDPSIRYQDMEHFKSVAHADTLLLLDDASFDVMKAEYLSKNKNSLDKAMHQEDNKLDLNALYSALVVTDYLQLDGACASPGALNARQNASIAAHYIL